MRIYCYICHMRKIFLLAAVSAMAVMLCTMCKKDEESVKTFPCEYTIQNNLSKDATLSVFKVGFIQSQFTVKSGNSYKFSTGYGYANDIFTCDSVYVSSGSNAITYYSSSVRTNETLRRLDYVLTSVDAWEGFAYTWTLDETTF